MENRIGYPDDDISNRHFAGLFQKIPENKNIEEYRGSDNCPTGCSQALYAVSQKANKTTDGQGTDEV